MACERSIEGCGRNTNKVFGGALEGTIIWGGAPEAASGTILSRGQSQRQQAVIVGDVCEKLCFCTIYNRGLFNLKVPVSPTSAPTKRCPHKNGVDPTCVKRICIYTQEKAHGMFRIKTPYQHLCN